MKTSFHLKLVVAFSFLMLAESLASTPAIDVFFLAGQSNASGRATIASEALPEVLYYYHTDGPAQRHSNSDSRFTELNALPNNYFGPEIGIGRELRRKNYTPAIIKISKGGTSLANDWNPQKKGECWQTWTQEASKALQALSAQGYQIRLRGFFWMQGESDANIKGRAAKYKNNFQAFITSVTQFLTTEGYQTDQMHFVTALIRSDRKEAKTIRAAQKETMDTMPNGDWFDTDDLTTIDGTHYDSESLQIIGARFADTFIKLSEQVHIAAPHQ
ncbi:sialate O-acetylesterase [Coraliomargarita sp. SDUM461004]|uniref:Sialate O-acetylesterase n=1 Tax=Thalassobacterium sedimentorum TaxID=3041258 RepID=A0ABU1AI10_9BACT|nr:sialate O-acetylesterase [Coraliomargarita sp. SDUM461004]MDQ8193510.1 sialate O-acetylesterase [Coraliomargarita sp. SDUM461004]